MNDSQVMIDKLDKIIDDLNLCLNDLPKHYMFKIYHLELVSMILTTMSFIRALSFSISEESKSIKELGND
jgi:hypothetical protein